ncbi:molybdopterin-binding protein [Nocardia sp. NPDC005978]|uniref:molybdopterin molybdotransferase MoeA n=1 Tax=Nocardia sp. NPDC005978 TaxID=3156725 RepID=UPI0033A62A26
MRSRSVEAMNGAGVAVEDLDPLLRAVLTPVPARTAPVVDALGATLAEPLVTAAHLPAVDTAAMDGFAVNGAGPRWSLRLGNQVAGRSAGSTLSDGEAIRISTGAPVPGGTTAVLRREYVHIERAGRCWSLRALPDAPRRNDLRARGEYWSAGVELAPAGARVDAALMSVALSAEAPVVAVRGPLRADVLLTGDEIRAAGALGPGQVRDALGAVLPHYLRGCDIECRRIWPMPDDRELLRSWFALDTDAELVVSVGGTGRGSADRLRAVLGELGARILIDGVRARPGGSQIVAELPDGRTLLALPGNPLAAVITLLVTGRALAGVRTGRRPDPPLWGRIADAAAPAHGPTRIVPARQLDGGVWRTHGATRTPHLADLLGAQALAVLPAGTGRGALVEIVPIPR